MMLASPTWNSPLPFGGTLCQPAHLYAKSARTCRQTFAAIPFCSAPKRTRLPTMSTIEFVDPKLRDALALWPHVSLTAETLTRRRADALALLSSVPTPDLARHRDGRDPRRECVWREADPGSDLSPGQVRRSAPRHCTHPWRGLRDGHAGNEGCGEQALRVRAEMRDLFRGLSPRAGSAAPGAAGGHLLGVCLAACECRSTRG